MIAQKTEPPRSTRTHTPSHGTPILQPPQHEHEPAPQRPQKNLSGGTILTIFVLIAGAFTGLFLAGWMPRQESSKRLGEEAHRIRTAAPLVRVMTPTLSPAISTVSLPGDVQAMEEITIYPRTTGYVKRWLVDIGDEVKEGQLIAEIDTPEISAQLQQSEAALAESEANLERAKATVNLAELTTTRLRTLVARKNAAQQELDDAENNLAVGKANVKLSEATIESNKANVQHMRELVSFSKIHAPFAGTVVGRFLDTGKLVTSGNGTGQALFQIARTNPVRVFIHVPQINAPGVAKGLNAEIFSREFPGRTFRGVVTRTARAIDPLTRTLLTEIEVPNEDRALLTGSYVQVRMDVERKSPALLIPTSALIFNAAGTQVAALTPDNKVELRQVAIEGDIGSQLGIASGISADEQIVINPGDRLSDGIEVEIQPEPQATTTDSKKPDTAPKKSH